MTGMGCCGEADLASNNEDGLWATGVIVQELGSVVDLVVVHKPGALPAVVRLHLQQPLNLSREVSQAWCHNEAEHALKSATYCVGSFCATADEMSPPNNSHGRERIIIQWEGDSRPGG